MTENQIIEKLSKKDLISFMGLKEEERKAFLEAKKEIIEKKEIKKNKMKNLLESIRIERNSIGLLVEVPSDLLDSNKKENYTLLVDFSQYGQFGKSTVDIEGKDGKKYGLLLTVIEKH